MTQCKRLRSLVVALGAIAVVGLPLAADPVQGLDDTDREVSLWAIGVWEAARAGDVVGLENHFDRIPAEGVPAESVDRFRASLERLRENRTTAAETRVEKRGAAIEAMREELEAEHLSKALRKAVEAQTYSDNLNSALDDPEIKQLIRWAGDRLKTAQFERGWLDAQEVLYLLRTFYEDTKRRGDFDRYDEQLKVVNRRVGLMALYCPQQLHEMRNKRAIRDGDEPFGDFNPATAVDWRERLEEVTPRMLREALHTAAREHIEAAGWRPLFEGGLQSLKLLATTSALSQTFPGLAHAGHVGEWTAKLEENVRLINATRDNDLDRWTLIDVLDDLLDTNEKTVRLPREVVIREFGDGALDQLDPYSEIIWPDKLRRFQQATAGNFIGVGILIRHNDKREIMVVNPLEGTPAYFEGIKPNDLIMKVDGDSTVGWSLNDAVDRITGPKGQEVRLGIKREGTEGLIDVPIERDVIKIRSVKGWSKKTLTEDGDPVWDWYIDSDSRIAYIRLTQFTEDSYTDLLDAWREIKAEGDPVGLVLDLRHNPGGLLTSAVRVSNLFVPRGSIVTGEDKNGKRAWRQEAHPNHATFAGTPTVVLVNRGSASASEIVAGCLQAHGAAIIVGERSFGKGSVQTIHHVARNGRLKLTTQYYRLPSSDGGKTQGRLVHKRPNADVWGVDPDIEVPMTVQQVADAITLRQKAEVIPLDEDGALNPDDPERPDIDSLLTDGIDSQLATALLILQARALASDDVRHAARGG